MEVTDPTATDLPRPLDSEVWAAMEMQPGFNEAMRKGEADLAAGRGTPFQEIRRDAG